MVVMYSLAGLAWTLTNLWVFMGDEPFRWLTDERFHRAYSIGVTIGVVVVGILWPLHMVLTVVGIVVLALRGPEKSSKDETNKKD